MTTRRAPDTSPTPSRRSADPAGSSLLDDLAPGARLTDRLFYDVPKNRTITSVRLRESTTSPGIRTALI